MYSYGGVNLWPAWHQLTVTFYENVGAAQLLVAIRPPHKRKFHRISRHMIRTRGGGGGSSSTYPAGTYEYPAADDVNSRPGHSGSSLSSQPNNGVGELV